MSWLACVASALNRFSSLCTQCNHISTIICKLLSQVRRYIMWLFDYYKSPTVTKIHQLWIHCSCDNAQAIRLIHNSSEMHGIPTFNWTLILNCNFTISTGNHSSVGNSQSRLVAHCAYCSYYVHICICMTFQCSPNCSLDDSNGIQPVKSTSTIPKISHFGTQPNPEQLWKNWPAKQKSKVAAVVVYVRVH